MRLTPADQQTKSTLLQRGCDIFEKEIDEGEVEACYRCSSCSKKFELCDDVIIVSEPHTGYETYHCSWRCLEVD